MNGSASILAKRVDIFPIVRVRVQSVISALPFIVLVHTTKTGTFIVSDWEINISPRDSLRFSWSDAADAIELRLSRHQSVTQETRQEDLLSASFFYPWMTAGDVVGIRGFSSRNPHWSYPRGTTFHRRLRGPVPNFQFLDGMLKTLTHLLREFKFIAEGKS